MQRNDSSQTKAWHKSTQNSSHFRWSLLSSFQMCTELLIKSISWIQTNSTATFQTILYPALYQPPDEIIARSPKATTLSMCLYPDWRSFPRKQAHSILPFSRNVQIVTCKRYYSPGLQFSSIILWRALLYIQSDFFVMMSKQKKLWLLHSSRVSWNCHEWIKSLQHHSLPPWWRSCWEEYFPWRQ